MAPPQHSQSNLLLRKRTSDIARRRSGQLGAVKRQQSGDENGLTGVPVESPSQGPASEARSAPPASTPPEPAPSEAAAQKGAEPPAAEDEPERQEAAGGADTPTLRFQRQLADSHTSDAWFDAQLTPPSGPPRNGAKWQASTASATPPVQSAASQIVDKALKYITADRSAATPPPARQQDAFRLGSVSILDKGLDAISGVGKLMETFAMTLDNVIGQAFEEWGTPGSSKSAERGPRPLRPHNSDARAGARRAAPKQGGTSGSRGAEARGAAGAALKQTHMTSFMSRVTDASEEDVAEWHKRAVSLQAELQKLQTQIQENQRLRDEYAKIQRDLQQTTSAVSKLEQENSRLKLRTAAPGADPEAVDQLAAEQVRLQMEALLAEKAKLAQENARLLRENNGLQELLEFTMLAQAEMVGDDELFSEEHASHATWSEPPSSAGTSPKSTSSALQAAGVAGPGAAPTAALAQLAL